MLLCTGHGRDLVQWYSMFPLLSFPFSTFLSSRFVQCIRILRDDHDIDRIESVSAQAQAYLATVETPCLQIAK